MTFDEWVYNSSPNRNILTDHEMRNARKNACAALSPTWNAALEEAVQVVLGSVPIENASGKCCHGHYRHETCVDCMADTISAMKTKGTNG